MVPESKVLFHILTMVFSTPFQELEDQATGYEAGEKQLGWKRYCSPSSTISSYLYGLFSSFLVSHSLQRARFLYQIITSLWEASLPDRKCAAIWSLVVGESRIEGLEGWMIGGDKVECFVCQSVESISVLCYHQEWDLFTFRARQVKSNAKDNCSPSTLSSLIFARKYEEQIYSLVNETTHVCSTVSLVFNRRELMCAKQGLCPILGRRMRWTTRSDEIQEAEEFELRSKVLDWIQRKQTCDIGKWHVAVQAHRSHRRKKQGPSIPNRTFSLQVNLDGGPAITTVTTR